MNLNRNKKGFTLLELLIVIAILGILGTIVIFLLNPAETLRKTRDSQRITDLGTIKSALGIYMSNAASVALDGGSNSKCQIYLWQSSSVANGSTSTLGGAYTTFVTSSQANSTLVNGSGWIPVNLTVLSGGSPISMMPIDPTNSAGSVPATSSLIYRYGCKATPIGFHLAAQMESNYYTGLSPSSTDIRAQDGGLIPWFYEVDSDSNTLPTSTSASY